MDWQPDQPTLDLIRHLALQNSYQYAGKGQAGSVIKNNGSRADLRQYWSHCLSAVSANAPREDLMLQEKFWKTRLLNY